MLEVITPASSINLTTAAAVRLNLGDNAPANDVIEAYIKQASSAIATYCNRTLVLETLRETIRLNGRPMIGRLDITLSRYPVVGAPTVTEGDVELEDGIDYEFDRQTAEFIRLRNDSPSYWPESKKIVIDYDAGYSSSTLPPEIERACIILISGLASFTERDPSVRIEMVSGIGQTSYDLGKGIPSSVAMLLAPYRAF